MSAFLDFVDKRGLAKITAVRKASEKYEVKQDYYKFLRDRIVSLQSRGTANPAQDADWLANINDKKTTNYQRALVSYRKWAAKNQAAWQEPISGTWTSNGLTVRVSPEFGLRLDGQLYLLKLHLKAKPISRLSRDVTLALLRSIVPASPQWTPGILDVERRRIIVADPQAELAVLLEAEATSFLSIWRALQSPASGS